jgi:CheY-like chemotaxis protein
MANILLVDDDEAFRRMLRLTLVRMGHAVDEAQDGMQAWTKIQAKPADLVIMDLIMPEKEGLETIRQFRRDGVKTIILAISGGGRVDAKDLLKIAHQFGANEVLAKPFTNEKLTAVLRKLLPAQG